MHSDNQSVSKEYIVSAKNGWSMLIFLIIYFFVDILIIIYFAKQGVSDRKLSSALFSICPFILFGIGLILSSGFFVLQPNEGRVLILFGNYKGTVKMPGFHWGNPFYSHDPAGKDEGEQSSSIFSTFSNPFSIRRNKISLRTRTLDSSLLKVNDRRGNPIEIAAVVVWRVSDTAKAYFDVDDYQKYVRTQSESALRHVATQYDYDRGEDDSETTLRGNVEVVSAALKVELTERMAPAGVAIDEARLTHLAYSPEIAQAMLRRQQAEAVIAARQKIVHGAVSMVEMALKELSTREIVKFNDDQKAAMVSNLMVVLCSETEVHPIVNTGLQTSRPSI